MVLEKTPESPLDSKEIKSVNSKGNQGYIFTGRTELKLQYKELRRADSLERTLILGKIEGRRKGQQRMRWLEYHLLKDMSFSKLWEIVNDREACCAVVHGVTKSWTQFND